MRTVAILGRPNVGKSTLFNRLVGRRQAIVDPTPGVTRDRLEGKGILAGLEFRVIDTAGIEDPERDDDLKDRLRRQTMAGLAEADVGLFMVDARAGLTAADRDIADLLRRQREKPILVLANKAEGATAMMQAQEAWGLGLGMPIPVSAREGDLLSVSPYTGEVLGKARVGGSVSLPPVAADGTVYFLTDGGELLAFR